MFRMSPTINHETVVDNSSPFGENGLFSNTAGDIEDIIKLMIL